MVISDKYYGTVKFITQVLLPAIGTLYFALASAWGLPAGSSVVGTIMAVDTFLGVTLHISTQTYNNSDAQYHGAVTLGATQPDGKQDVTLSLPPTSAEIASQDKLVLKVNK